MSTQTSRPESQPISYCRNRTRDRFPYFFLGLLLLFLGLCMGVYGAVTLGENKSGWNYMDYVTLVIGWVGCLGFTAAGIGESYISLREVFSPAKSAIAKSIRSQMPRPDEAPDWQELFAMVDRDLAATGRWFGKVGIGSQWLLGDEVSFLPRIRGVFGRNEIRRTTGSRHTRIVQLFIIDDRKKAQVTGFQDPRDLEAVIQYLRLRVPAAYFGSYHDFIGFCDRTDDEWEQMEREFRQRQAQAEQRIRETVPVQAGQGFVLVDYPSGRRTSQVDREGLTRRLDALELGNQFRLEMTPPIPTEEMGELVAINCVREENTAYRLVVQPRIGDSGEAMGFLRVKAMKEDVLELLIRLVERGEVPDFTASGWQAVPFRKMPAPQADRQTPPYLNITDGAGIERRYERFSRRDVELAAEKVADGSYRGAILWLPPRLAFLDAGTSEDGRVTVQIGLPGEKGFRTRMAKTTGRQAAEWFIGCLEGKLPDDFESWKDVTRDWEKRVEKMEKQKAKDAAKK